jgi:hypothetical protein
MSTTKRARRTDRGDGPPGRTERSLRIVGVGPDGGRRRPKRSEVGRGGRERAGQALLDSLAFVRRFL